MTFQKFLGTTTLIWSGEKEIFTRFDEPRNDSQDCWIFKSPLNIDLNKINFSFRTLGCDSIFAKHVYDTGIKIHCQEQKPPSQISHFNACFIGVLHDKSSGRSPERA